MILSLLDSAPHDDASLLSLLRKPRKDGAPEARGPLIEGPFAPGARPLAALADGDKLHIVARGGRGSVAELVAEELVDRLEALGLGRSVRLRQIHLIVDNTGVGDSASFAEHFAAALAAGGFQVMEIKAPRGCVRSDENGKVHILPVEAQESLAKPRSETTDPVAVTDALAAQGWVPSRKELNYYTGPQVQEKHRS